MKPPILTLTALALTANILLGGEVVQDPVAHFKATWDLEGVAKILKLEADLNGDGVKEVLLSNGKVETGEVELGWQLYVGRAGGGYVVAPQKTDSGEDPSGLPGFRRDQYKVGMIDELQSPGLLFLSCGNGGQAKCQLMAVVVVGEAWKQVAIGAPVSAEDHYTELAKRFTTPPVPAVVKVDR